MSYQSWHIYGYGICVSDLEIESPERVRELLHHAPEYERQVEQWLKKENITDPTVEDYGEVDNEFLLGFATLLKKVIAEAEHIQFTACDDYEGMDYLVYEPTYPWNRQEADQKVTQNVIRQIKCGFIYQIIYACFKNSDYRIAALFTAILSGYLMPRAITQIT